MDLTVRLFAVLKERAGRGEIELRDLPDDLDLCALKREIGRRHPELGDLSHVAGVVGTQYAKDDTRLKPGDCVALLPPVSGGSGDALEEGVFELSAEPLDSARCQERVLSDGCGAVVLFTGCTRATNRGERVVRLEYEAFDAMTVPEMARIFARCRAQVGDPTDTRSERALRMLCQHRVGVVEVGQPSVVIAVASAHRAAAFEACRFLIDELKRTLPVWKKEIYADGHHWIGDRS